MEGLLVSAATGALKPVLEKLAALLGDEYKRFKGMRSQVKYLAEELDAMHAFLLTKSEEENPNPQDKSWMQVVRELSYDIEDSIDEFMLHVDDGKSDNPPDGFMDKFNNILTKAMARRRIAKAMEHLKDQVREVADRNKRYRSCEYRSCETITNASNATVDRRALAIFKDASKLVGIKRPKDELIKLLKKEDGSTSPQQPRVVSIVGFGGMGKTTLANQVYEGVKREFECWAFVSVSRNPDMMKILRMIFSEVTREPYAYTKAGDIQQLIRKITEFLEDKRYLIVIDDVWKIDTWEIIKCALLKNKGNCRIIITTRLLDVAKSCCSSDADYVYKIRPLSPAASKELFFKRVFGSHGKCPEHLIELSNKILRKCGGLPLGVISISGLLANKPQTLDHWDAVQKSIGRALGKNPDVQSMMQILSLSYFDLPCHLRTCLLYLSTFPEDSIIEKNQLIRKWTAEGFIQKENGHTLYELGERCFNELINRSLIQAHHINIYGEVTACQVHDTILDFISVKSEEQNFVIVLHDDNHELFDPNMKVRRLSLHASSKDNVSMPLEMDLSHVRSLSYHMKEPFSEDLTDFIDFASFSFLRVLDFEGCRQLKDHHLANIWNLFQLKYLSLCGTRVCHLSEKIKKLQYLETLNTQNSGVRKLPTSITELRRLVHLIVGERVKLPNGIGGMVALEMLECVDVFQQSIDIILELGKLTSLKSISLFLNSEIVEGCRYKDIIHNIVSSLSNLDCIHSLIIDIQAICCYLEDSKLAEDLHLDSKACAPISLRKFIMTEGFISKVPNWMGYLLSLEQLILCVKELEVEDVLSLGRLLALVFIQLIAHNSFQGRRVTIWGRDGFHCVKHFDFRCAIPVTFEVGAMPKLEKLSLMFNTLETDLMVSHGDFSFGIEHLSSLKSICCILHLRMGAIDDWIAEKKTLITGMSCKVAMAVLDEKKIRGLFMGAAGAIQRAVRVHPKSPKFVLRETSSWQTGRYDLVKSNFEDIIDFYRIFQLKVRHLRIQVEERIRNC